ncbi:MAG: LysR family transcriptional regulator [Spirochaetales bacterium]|nr:LysR family transcriptional regulator [Spirochaetales bacterium]
MELRKITCFVEVARLKSFSKAAQILYVTQTAVSQQIVVLENELGFKLFYRDKKKVQLTPAGEVFFDEAVHILRQYENSVSKAMDVSCGYEGILKIGFFSMFDREVIAPVISGYRNKFPKVRLSTAQCNYHDMKTNILNGTIDIGFSFIFDSDEVNEYKVKQSFPKLCVNKHNPLSSKSCIYAGDLENESVISYIKNVEQQECYNFYYNHKNPETISDKSILVENMDDAVMMVSINAGICFLPEVKSFINPEIISFIDQKVESVPFDVNAYWTNYNNSEVLHNFLKVLKEYYPE